MEFKPESGIIVKWPDCLREILLRTTRWTKQVRDSIRNDNKDDQTQNLRPRGAFFFHVIPLLCRGPVSTMLMAAAKTVFLKLWTENLTLSFHNKEVLNDVDEESKSQSNVLGHGLDVHFEWSPSLASSNELSAEVSLGTVGSFFNNTTFWFEYLQTLP